MLGLPPGVERMGRSDFIVVDANAGDLAALDAWRRGDEAALAICGPARAGKTHLCRIVAADARGEVVSTTAPNAADLARALLDQGRLVALDGLENGPSPETALALAERARAGPGRLVLAGRGDPSDWARGLNDLRTRLEAMLRIRVTAPDEPLLRLVMAKLFADRQLRVEPRVIAYAAPRLRRSLDAAMAFCAAADARAMDAKSAVTIAVARQAVADAEAALAAGPGGSVASAEGEG